MTTIAFQKVIISPAFTIIATAGANAAYTPTGA